MQGERLFHDEGAAVGIFGNVLVTIAHGPANETNMRMARSAHKELSLRHPKGYVHLIVTAATAPPPPPELRREMQELTTEFGPRMRAHAIVLEGEGLVAATLRLVTQTMLLAIPRGHPHRAFAQIGHATRWIRDRCLPDGHIDPDDLDAFVESLRVRPAVALGA